jgi:hypothetical protein
MAISRSRKEHRLNRHGLRPAHGIAAPTMRRSSPSATPGCRGGDHLRELSARAGLQGRAGLFTGNTVIAKPAPTTPLTTLLLGEIGADIFRPVSSKLWPISTISSSSVASAAIVWSMKSLSGIAASLLGSPIRSVSAGIPALNTVPRYLANNTLLDL